MADRLYCALNGTTLRDLDARIHLLDVEELAPAVRTVTANRIGGGLHLLGTQLIGFAAVAGWAAVTLTITFFILNKTVGLRVSAEEEIKGLDATEHNLPSAYADFMPVGGGFAAVPVTDSFLPAAPVE